MKQYLKMADVFVGEYKPKRRIDAWPPSKYGETLIELSGSPAQYAAHAINSHDELVAEVERLRGALQDAYLDGCYAGLGMSGQGYNAEHGGPKDWALHDMLVTKSLGYVK